MFKVFHRGHNKVQFNSTASNELSSNTSINKIKNANLALSYDHIRRRNSIRSTSVFGETDFDSISIGQSNLAASNKKYVSCDNFARNFEDEYQEVIDEEFDEENSFKNKLLKPYNSVTNLLMRSFRKARIKKKKEAMLQETFIDENEIPQSHQQQHKVSKSKLNSQRESVFFEQDEFKEDENKNNSKTKLDESVPLFIGKRIISNEFVEHDNNKKLQPNEASTKSVSKKEPIKIVKDINQSISNSNQSKKPVNPTQSIRLNIGSKTSLNSGSIAKSIPSSKLDNFGRIEQSSAIEILQRFSSHMKPQAPKPPEIAPSTSAAANKQADSKKIDPIEVKPSETESVKQESTQLPLAQIESTVEISKIVDETVLAPKKPAVVKRSKTFTQQLQDMLKDHRLSRPEVHSPIVLSKKSDKQMEKSFEASVLSDDKSMHSNTNMSNMTSSLIIDSSVPKSHEFSQDYFDLMEDANYQFKSINDFNKMQMIVTNNISDDDYKIDKRDELKNLIQVLDKQEPEFKSKFFDCLMSKLWDPSLPIKEYVKLNKLMAALFGENYHKMDSSYSSKAFPRNAEYSNCKSNKNTQIDAEYIVNLMKVYLDSKSSCSKSLNVENNSEDKIKTNNTSNNERDLSINNLINTLRNRPKDELLEQNSRITPRSTNFNSVGSNNIYDIDEKLQLYGNEFSFRNGFNGLNGDLKAQQQAKAKSSLILKIDDSAALEEDGDAYYKENFTNMSMFEDYSTKTSIINDESLMSSSHFQRDSKLRKTLFNYERPSTSVSQLSNKGSVSDESNRGKKLSMENKIEKLIKTNHFNATSSMIPNDMNMSINTSINNEISMIANNITKLSRSNLSDNDQKSSLDSFSTKLGESSACKVNKITSFQPDHASKQEQPRSRSEKIKPTFNVVRTIVHPPKPKIAMKINENENLLKQKQFKVVNLFKNVNENILKHSYPYAAAATSMRHRDGPFLEPQFVNRNTKDEPIYQVQKITHHAEFNPIGSINKSISKAYAYLEEKNSKSLNHLNDHYSSTIAQSQHSRINKTPNCDYSYEPVRKIFTHHLKELMSEKHYKFERKDIQLAPKSSNSKNKLTLVTY